MARNKDAVVIVSLCPNCKQEMPPFLDIPKPNIDEVFSVWLILNNEYLDDQAVKRGQHPECPARNHFRSQAAYDRYSD